MIRCVACDIDGTLLHGEEKVLSPELLGHIERLGALGVRFCPASGRQYSSLRSLFAPVADELYYVCENGAVVYGPGSPGPVLAKKSMDRAAALEVCREILATEGCEVMISGADTSYLCPKEADVVDHVRFSVGNRLTVLERPEQVPEDIVKVSAYCRQGSRAVEPLLAPPWRGTFRTAVAGEKWLDFTTADKGIGVRALCSAMGVALEEVMAFGDNYNDVPMLKIVGEPYLMENAAPELRARFERRCVRVEDVLAALCERIEQGR